MGGAIVRSEPSRFSMITTRPGTDCADHRSPRRQHEFELATGRGRRGPAPPPDQRNGANLGFEAQLFLATDLAERRGRVIAVELGPTGLHQEEPDGSAEGGSLRAVTRAV
jgi:hypothetical protein